MEGKKVVTISVFPKTLSEKERERWGIVDQGG